MATIDPLVTESSRAAGDPVTGETRFGRCAACNTPLTGPGWTAVAGRVCDRCAKTWATIHQTLSSADTKATRQERFNELARAWLAAYKDDLGRTWRELAPTQIHHANSPCYQAFVASHPCDLEHKLALKKALAQLKSQPISYAPIWELETFVNGWLDNTSGRDPAARLETMRGIKERETKDLDAVIAYVNGRAVYRKGDLWQACNNVYDRLRRQAGKLVTGSAPADGAAVTNDAPAGRPLVESFMAHAGPITHSPPEPEIGDFSTLLVYHDAGDGRAYDKPAPFLVAAYGIPPHTAMRLQLLIESLAAAVAAVTQAEADEAEWRAKPRCNGTRYWPAAPPHNGVYLFANHSAGGECPLHGRHPSGGRLKRGIGRDREAHLATEEAMRNWTTWQEKVGILRRVRAKLETLTRQVNEIRVR